MQDAVQQANDCAIEQWHGKVVINKTVYKPLEKVSVAISQPARGASDFLAVWHDGLGRPYGRKRGRLLQDDGMAVVEFLAGGAAGMQFVTVCFDPDNGNSRHHRIINYFLETTTEMVCDSSVSKAPDLAKNLVRLNKRKYDLDGRAVIGYTTADSGNTLDFWLRDMYYGLFAFSFWEADIKSGFEAFWERQHDTGSFPDWIDANGNHGRMTSESDLEYIAVLALEFIWMLYGDTGYLHKYLPVVEKGIEYLTTDALRWDTRTGLVKRGHTCDTWDFDIEYDVYMPDRSAVASNCDQSGLYAAFLALARMNGCLGFREKSELYARKAAELGNRCDELFWDGVKYRHHIHLNLPEHEDFDESAQLSMGNTWMLTRLVADPDKALSVIGEYEKRMSATGQCFPWWSLDPAYPVSMGKVLSENASYLQPGGYCNGGLMPWVGGELCLAAFLNGKEQFAWKLLQDFSGFFSGNNGQLYVWYWPDMQPGFRTNTPNTTAHDGWAMGCWMKAISQGLAGFEILEPGMTAVRLAPRWAATAITGAFVSFHYPSTDKYIAYRYQMVENEMRIVATGCADKLAFSVLIPEGRRAAGVCVCGAAVPVRLNRVSESCYAEFTVNCAGIVDVSIELE